MTSLNTSKPDRSETVGWSLRDTVHDDCQRMKGVVTGARILLSKAYWQEVQAGHFEFSEQRLHRIGQYLFTVDGSVARQVAREQVRAERGWEVQLSQSVRNNAVPDAARKQSRTDTQ